MLLDNEIIKTDSYTNFSVYLSVFLLAKYKKVFRKKVLILMKKDSLDYCIACFRGYADCVKGAKELSGPSKRRKVLRVVYVVTIWYVVIYN